MSRSSVAAIAASLALHAIAVAIWGALASRDARPLVRPREAPAVERVRLVSRRAPAPPVPVPAVERPPPPPAPARARARKPAPVVVTAEPAPAEVASESPSETEPEASVLAAVAAAPPVRAIAEEIEIYAARVRARIEARESYPAMARRRGIEGLVVLRLSIAGDGALDAIDVAGAAPSLLERAARAAASDAAPFDAPPSGPLQVEVPMRYSLAR